MPLGFWNREPLFISVKFPAPYRVPDSLNHPALPYVILRKPRKTWSHIEGHWLREVWGTSDIVRAEDGLGQYVVDDIGMETLE